MRKFVVVTIAALLAALVLPALAQRARNGRKATGAGSTAADGKGDKDSAGKVAVTLGKSALTSGVVRKAVFDSFARQGLIPGTGTVKEFFFTYAERNLYEDSVGNPMIVTDLLTESCYGPRLSAGITETLFDRTKAGDTAFFENIKLILPNGATAWGRNMKFVLAR